MIIQTIVDRLNAAAPLLGKRARLMRDITDIEDIDQDLPAAFVLRLSDTAAQQNGVGRLVTQQRTRQFVVTLMAAPVTSNAEPMEPLRTQIHAALIDWAGQDEQIEYAGGEALPPIGGVDRWQDRYQYTDHIRYQL